LGGLAEALEIEAAWCEIGDVGGVGDFSQGELAGGQGSVVVEAG